jgi:RNA recognition motif-containing protein
MEGKFKVNSIRAIQVSQANERKDGGRDNSRGKRDDRRDDRRSRQRRDSRSRSRSRDNDNSGPKHTIFVGNLGFRTTDRDIRNFFRDCGKVTDVRIAKNDEGKVRS